MFLEQFKITGMAMAQIFLLGGLGYILVKRQILSHAGLDALSWLVIQVILPALIVSQMLKNFRFIAVYASVWLVGTRSSIVNHGIISIYFY